MSIKQIAYHQGIADFIRFHTRCPVYWRGTDEEKHWHDGQKYARKQTLYPRGRK